MKFFAENVKLLIWAVPLVLCCSGQTECASTDIVSPLQRLYALRTVVRGHAAIEKRRVAASSARTQFGTLRSHFQHLIADCEQALNAILKSLGLDKNLGLGQ